VKCCGVYGADLHIVHGDFESALTQGSQQRGIVVKIEENFEGFKTEDKVTANISELCGHCHFCRQGKLFCCENFVTHRVPSEFRLSEWLSRWKLTIVRFCRVRVSSRPRLVPARHGIDRIRPKVGSNILLIRANATNLYLAKLLEANGSAHLVLASNEGPNMELAKKLNCPDEYVELSRKYQTQQWVDLKAKYP
ncbi:hypothetical protein BJ875DRAFT_518152, partial [Amylocarpus encephaloides]